MRVDEYETLAKEMSNFSFSNFDRSSNSSPYLEFLVQHLHVQLLFSYLLDQVISQESVFDIYAPFPFENCSIRHNQVYLKFDERWCLTTILE